MSIKSALRQAATWTRMGCAVAAGLVMATPSLGAPTSLTPPAAQPCSSTCPGLRKNAAGPSSATAPRPNGSFGPSRSSSSASAGR